MKKMIIIWSNGDKEKVEVSDEYISKFSPQTKGFTGWLLTLENVEGKTVGCLNLQYARKVYLE